MTTPKTIGEAYADAAEIAWSDDDDRPWENWGEHRNIVTAQTVAKEIKAAILARAAEVAEPAMTGVRVKLLVWQETPNDKTLVADHGAGHYIVTHDFDGWRWLLVNGRDMAGAQDHPVPEKEAAKAAAQADYESRILAALVPPAIPTLADVIAHYGIDALCKALAPEIVREALEQPTPWTPPEDRGDGFECLAWLEANRLQTMGVGGWEKVRWERSVLTPPGYWWCPHGGEQVSPAAFAPLPGDAG